MMYSVTSVSDLPPVVVFLVSCAILWVLVNKLKNSKANHGTQNMQLQPSLRRILKGIVTFIRWQLDKSPTKPHIIEKLYRGDEFKDVFSVKKPKLIKLLNMTVVFNDDVNSVRHLLNTSECSVKLPATLADILSDGHCRGLLWNDGPNWKELRKYSVKKLGQLGFGKNDKLSLILSELLPDLLSHVAALKQNTGNKIPIKNLFVLYVINVVWCIIGGYKFSLNDKNFEILHKNIDTMTNWPIWKCHLINFLPNNKIINYLLGYNPFYESIRNVNDYIKGFVAEKIKQNKEKTEPGDFFVDHFLLEVEKHKDNKELNHIYSKEQLISVLVDLFAAGMDTTSKFLELSLMFMILNPEIQQKVQEEINLVIGNNKPSYSDHRKSMPYTFATMMEIHRMGSVVPIITRHIPHDFNNSTGLVFEKGTQIVNVMWALRMDDDYWGDPTVFRPERFLDEENNFIMEKMNRVMPFGAGIRICPGESVSSASSFTFLVGILQNYTVTKAVKDELLGIEKGCGLVTQTLPFHISLQEIQS